MRLTVIGCGYLGGVHAAAMASLGHEVLGIDTDPRRVDALSQGSPPFYEPGFEALLREQLDAGRLRLTSAPTDTELAEAQVHFITVGTPQSDQGGAADLGHVWAVVDMLSRALPEGGTPLVVGKSTVPVGTADQVSARLKGRADVLWNPEFLREGFAVGDTLHPDRIVYGLPADPRAAARAASTLDAVYADLLTEGIARITTSYATAELVKTAANAFLATKISFINAIASVCDAAGADVTVLADAIGRDSRIGSRFLRAGVGFGGGCLPKDIRALAVRAEELGATGLTGLLSQVDAINRGRRELIVDQAVTELDGTLQGARITLLGAAFKPDSDDVRDSPALEVAAVLAARGAAVTVSDPRALPSVARLHPELMTQADPEAALVGADLVILLTEWRQFSQIDPVRAAELVARPVVIDGRNALDPRAWRAAGWRYIGSGR